ncbi:MAG TPA: hypothetical protein VFO66_12410 [Gemmatimonadaceae bacterium]|nr:hypothetical protein [Gemmatimonadaceae bacterium]
MWDLAVREDDYPAVDSMLSRFQGAPLSYRIPPAHARGDSAAIARLHAEARQLDARQSQIAARFVATYLGDLATAESLARLDLQPRRNASIRLGAQTFLAWLELARGNWGGAKTAFGAAERMEGGQSVLLERALAATLPFVKVPTNDVGAIRAELERWTPAPVAGGTLLTSLEPHLRLYLIGLLSARLGAHDAAESRARELDALAVPPQGSKVVRALAATVRADVAMKQGQPGRALTLLEAADGQVPLELVVVRPFVNARQYSQEHARYLRAEALRALGRADEARRWQATSFQGSPLELVYRVAQ